MDQNFNSLYKIDIGFAVQNNQLSVLDESKLDDVLEYGNYDQRYFQMSYLMPALGISR